MTTPTPDSTEDKEQPTGYIKVTLDYCPKTNGEKFKKWCVDHGFDYLGSNRRAWCSQFGTYLRGASGVAYSDGEPFLFYEDDLVDLNAHYLPRQAIAEALDKLEKPTLGIKEPSESKVISGRQSYNKALADIRAALKTEQNNGA